MDYAEARSAFFQPRSADAPGPGSSTWQTPGRVLRDAIEPVATICFWAEPAYESYSTNGLDFLEGYVWGRSCVLGEPEGLVAASAFGVFEPSLIAGLIESARAKCGLAEVRAAKEAGAIESLRQVLGQPAYLEETISVLRRGVEAADPSGRPMHAGLTALPWPADPLGQLWHACTILREHRGDGHVAAWVAAGLNGLEANILTELVVGGSRAPIPPPVAGRQMPSGRRWTRSSGADWWLMGRFPRRGGCCGTASKRPRIA
jgi:hypothetical protein